jgi:hypothetical protein
MVQRLDILVHDLDPFDTRLYVVKQCIPLWEERGIACHVRCGLQVPRRADAVFLHVDLTRVPQDYVAAAREYPIGINVAVTDVSKRHISAGVVKRGDAYDGPVIVKTNLNMGGAPEVHHEIRRRQALTGQDPSEIQIPVPLGPHAYPIFESPRQVPIWMWRHGKLVVEKFQPEMQDGLYCLRQWLFLGDQEMGYLSFSKHRVIKSNRIIRWEPLHDVPADLREARRRLGFDFGKFDYTLVDGKPVLFDANRTPASRGSGVKDDIITRLASGIAALLPA